MSETESFFACPICKSKLANFSCESCKICFPKKVVPSFICREMYPSEQSYEDAMRVIDFWGNGWKKRLKESDHGFVYDLDTKELEAYADHELALHALQQGIMGLEVPTQKISGLSVLNIGCGCGTEAVILARAGALCLAMDITEPAANATDLLLRKMGGGFGMQGDARFIPLQSESVDIVFSSGVLHHSSDIPKSISEIHRVLKPGGVAYIMLYATWSIAFLQEKFWHQAGEASWNTEGRKNPCTITYSVDECKNLFSEFEIVSISKRNARLKNLYKIGRYMPTCFDKYLDCLGANLNIVVKKSNNS